MRCRQYTPSSNATTPESNKSDPSLPANLRNLALHISLNQCPSDYPKTVQHAIDYYAAFTVAELDDFLGFDHGAGHFRPLGIIG